jgi:type IX secretion system PorP/SprF family membrane protein
MMKSFTNLTFKVLVLLLCFKEVKAQQNIQFTQYIFNALSVNPAYAGYKEEWFAQMGLRSQWVDVKGAPRTGLLSIDGVTDQVGKRHGVGLQITADALGPQVATSMYANYAFRLRLNQEDTHRISFGFAAGMTQYSLNGAMLSPNSPGDPVLPTGKISNYVPNVHFGVYYANPTWYAGLSMMDLLESNHNVFRWDNTTTAHIRRKPHAYFIAGFLTDLSPGIKLRPSVLWKEDFKGPSSLDLNASFVFAERIWLGAGWRTGVRAFEKKFERVTGNSLSNQNSVSVLAQLYVNRNLRVGYSYDHMLGRISSVMNGSHELTLGVTFGYQQRILSPRFF